MSARFHDLATIAVLWRRDLLLFARQRSRLLGALLPPLLLWLAIGAGISPSFAAGRGGVGYMEYLFPGMIFMLVLQSSISATMSVIEDRRQGFLQGVLVGPGSRSALVLGKSLGSATVALVHAAAFLALAPFAGYAYGGISWLGILASLGLIALTLTTLGFMIAWALDSVQGYHVVMNLALFPLWILSGAMFPVEGLHPVMAAFVRWNPLTYAMSTLRRTIYGGAAPEGTLPEGATALGDSAVLLGTLGVLLVLACWTTARRPVSE